MPTISGPAKSSSLQSGLKSLKRDWSDNNEPATSKLRSSAQASRPMASSSSHTDAAARERRLAAIKAALEDMNAASESIKTSIGNPLQSSSLANSKYYTSTKRPSDSLDSDENAKKKRILPDSFMSSTSAKSKPSSSSHSAPTSTASMTVMNVTRQEQPKKKTVDKPAAIFLSKEQIRILELVRGGQSLFYTGSAGTGKSVLLREIIKSLRKKYGNSSEAVAVTASTGIAACNIGGVTVHSFGGLSLGGESVDKMISYVRKNKKAHQRWMRTKALIIDEVSMLDGDLFDKMSQIACNLRKDPKPFGSIQVIVTGDFFQLPPVTKNGDPKFAFEASVWAELISDHSYNLTKVFRQKDEEFVNMLNEMRFGNLTPKSIAKFRSLSRIIHYDDGVGATELFPLRVDVDRSNSGRMGHLHTEKQVYRASDGGSITNPAQRERMLANMMAPAVLELKIDAQVMLIKNMDETLVNGSIGKVIRFIDPVQAKDEGIYPPDDGDSDGKQLKKSVTKSGQLWPVVAFPLPGNYIKEVMIVPDTFKVELPNGEIQISRTQLPLILAWAMSIHKSQGQTLERVKVDLGKVFEKGQAYVALSRATSMEGLQVLNFDPKKVLAHPKVIEWSKTLRTVPS